MVLAAAGWVYSPLPKKPTNQAKTKQIKIVALKPLKDNFLIRGNFPHLWLRQDSLPGPRGLWPGNCSEEASKDQGWPGIQCERRPFHFVLRL